MPENSKFVHDNAFDRLRDDAGLFVSVDELIATAKLYTPEETTHTKRNQDGIKDLGKELG